MKKLFKILVAVAFAICLMPIGISAQTNNPNVISEEDLTVEERKHLDEQERKMNDSGYTLESRKIIINKDQPFTRASSTYGIDRVSVESVCTGTTKNHATSRNKGMLYLLDVSYSFFIDALSKRLEFVSHVANVLNVSPSDFSTTWIQGDSLKSTPSHVITTDFYRETDAVGLVCSYFVTEKTAAKVYWNLYTPKNGAPSRKTETDSKTFATKYYYNQSYCFAKARDLRDSGVIYTTDDVY